jgi:hypothetical protein
MSSVDGFGLGTMAATAMPRLLALLVALLALGAPEPGAAAARKLRWRSLDVEASLDAEGKLHVSERHAMVFSGPWNGGERIFDLRPGQQLAVERLLRLDPGGAAPREVLPGSLDQVDRRALVDRRTLRWRSRAPGDPEFSETEIVYVLDYVLSGVLVGEGGGRYRLSHDFAFPDREWPVERFTARLTVDPSWQVEPGAPLRMEARDLAPGTGAVTTLTLTRDGAALPLAQDAVAPPARRPAAGASVPARIALAAFLAVGLAVVAVVLVRHARARGQLAPLPTGIDEAWLREHVLALPPEVVGATWDRLVAGPEVSAVLAGMALQGKIQGHRTSVRSWFGRRRHRDELRLCVPREELTGRQRALVDGIFVDGDTIDADRLRAHYRQKGFDPAALLRGELDAEVARLVPDGEVPRKTPPLVVSVILFALAQAAMVAVAVRQGDAGLAVGVAVLSEVPMVLALVAALLLQRTVARARACVAALLAVLAAWAGLLLAFAVVDDTVDPLLLGSAAALWAGGAVLSTWLGRTRSSAAGIALRQRLTAARQYFARELASPRPRLDDAWAPYLVALELGRELDGWVRVHGSARGVARAASVGGGHGSGGGWTGGGGSFGGAGATGTWTALGSISSSIPSPSSSRGGGGGGGSSGGGGGGGW